MTQAKQKQSRNNQLRIIGGQWRGRKLNFPDLPGLRPTSDRIRETLFNWLQADIIGARCLDLFAGSGAVGFEALSRGAAEVVFVDNMQAAVSQLNQNLTMLKNEKGQVFRGDALSFVQRDDMVPFDIVFLDPPFKSGLLGKCISALEQSSCLKKDSLIYIENEKQLDVAVPANWNSLKEKKAGQVKYALYEVSGS